MKSASILITLCLTGLLSLAQPATSRRCVASRPNPHALSAIGKTSMPHPEPKNVGDYMRRLAAGLTTSIALRQDNAEWILEKLKSWGLDAKIETFEVLFPTPKDRALELMEPGHFKAKLEEPALAVDPPPPAQ